MQTAFTGRGGRAHGLGDLAPISPVLLAEAGTQSSHQRARPLGRRWRGDERSGVGRPCSYSTAKADRPLLLAGRGGSPVFRSLSFPQSRGMARRKAHVPDFAGTARMTPGDPEAPGLTHQRMRPRLSTRHRGICPLSRFSLSGLGDPSVVRFEFDPEAARGRDHDSRPQVPHPAPSLRRLARTPLGGRDGWEYIQEIEQVKNDFHVSCISLEAMSEPLKAARYQLLYTAVVT